MKKNIISIINMQRKEHTPIELKNLIKNVVTKVLDDAGLSGCEVSVSLVDNNKIKQLNRDFRNIDSETDVLSFPSGEYPGGQYLGDMAISLEKARKQSIEYCHSYEREIAFLTAHSVLHLLGYDHEEDESVMFKKQEEILDKMGISR